MPKYTKHNYKPILSILGISAFITMGYLLSTRILSPEPISINEVTSTGTVSLALLPPTSMTRPNLERMVEVNVSAGTDRLTAVQLELTYDPTALLLTNLTNTTYLANTLAAPTIGNGVAKATFGAALESGGITGSGNFATFKVKALKPGSFTLSFGQNTLATATSSSSNVLKSVSGMNFQALYPGDINGDNKVTLADYNIFLPAYGAPTPDFALVDLNSSGQVDLLDYNILVANYGKTYP